MLSKPSSTAGKIVLGSLFAFLITTGCNNSSEEKKAPATDTTQPAPAPVQDSVDTAAEKPVVTPN